MFLMSMSDVYVCGIHRNPLVQSAENLVCSDCDVPYEIRDSIWLLDPVQRWDRAEFDIQVQNDPVPLDLSKAQKHLAAAGVGVLRNAVILDVGCGRGDLSCSLAQSEQIEDSDIYAFDHSVESVGQAKSIMEAKNGNRPHFSVQDASLLYFAENSFDFVVGAAVLHHIADYPKLLASIWRILKPNGVAVFSEPFFYGYLWPCLMLKNAVEELDLDIDAPEFGLCRFITDFVAFVARHSEDPAALESLTDKHFFRDSAVLNAARDAGFRSTNLTPAAVPEFYENWMSHFMDTYVIQHRELRRAAIRQYERLKALAGPVLPELVSHFKYIVLRK